MGREHGRPGIRVDSENRRVASGGSSGSGWFRSMTRRLKARPVVALLVAVGLAGGAGGLGAEDPFLADPFEGIPTVGGGNAARPQEARAEAKPDAGPPPEAKPGLAGPRLAGPREDTPRDAPPTACLSLRLPVTGTRDMQLEAAVLRALPRLIGEPGRRGVLVLRFDASSADADESDFGRSFDLARFLCDQRLSGVRTIAYLPQGAAGHAVLVALACEEIVMPPEAVVGPAVADGRIDDAVRAGYRQIAEARRSVPPALAAALVDPLARSLRVRTEAGEVFIDQSERQALENRTAVLAVEELQPVPLALDGGRARQLGVARVLARSADEASAALGLPKAAFAADPSALDGWKATQVVLSGPVDGAAVARIRSRIARAVAEGTNFLCLRIESDGGSPEQSLVLAGELAALDASRLRSVAWVPKRARGDAALVAMACDELVMHPDAILGGAGAADIDERQGDTIATAWRTAVAGVKGKTWSLPVALLEPGLIVRRATQAETGRVEFFCEEELAARPDRDTWTTGVQVGIGPIQLGGRTAESLGLAQHLVEDVAGLAAAYGLEGEMATLEPKWSETLLDALASPGVAWLLLVIGGAGLYLELHTPGLGLGGFVAMVAFIVYFWGQYLHGTAGWLEAMLFVAGVFCIAAEVLVLPGVGVLGFGGGLLVIASLVLASQSFVIPGNAYQVRQLQWSLLGILGAVAGVGVFAALVRRWLPATPMLRHVLLEPPEFEQADDTPAAIDLFGATGQTTTRLAPAGKALIGARVLDVTTLGRLVEPGQTVRVVEVRSGRVIVEPVARQDADDRRIPGPTES
jgi:membrane-bound serine protease (ClpP class)